MSTSSAAPRGHSYAARAARLGGNVATPLAVFYVVLWASAYVPSKIGATAMPPLWFLVARFLAAGSLMLAWCIVAGKRISIDITEAWRLALIGVLLLVGGNTSVAWSEQYTPSGISALIVAIVPLWVMLLERFTRRGERLSQGGLLGLVIGIAGMAVLLWPKVTSGNPGRGELIGYLLPARPEIAQGFQRNAWPENSSGFKLARVDLLGGCGKFARRVVECLVRRELRLNFIESLQSGIGSRDDVRQGHSTGCCCRRGRRRRRRRRGCVLGLCAKRKAQ